MAWDGEQINFHKWLIQTSILHFDKTAGPHMVIPVAALTQGELEAVPLARSSGVLNLVLGVTDSQVLWGVDHIVPNIPDLPLLPHVNMAVSLGPVSDPGAEMTILEVKQELQSQLEQSKQDFRDLKEKFLVSESTAYILANQLQKYSKSYRVMVTRDFQQVRVTLRVWAVRHGQSENDECGACKDIIESVLGEKLQFQEGKPTEKSTLVEKLKWQRKSVALLVGAFPPACIRPWDAVYREEEEMIRHPVIIYGSTLCMFKWSLLCHPRKYDVLIQDQAQELAQLRQTIEKGIELSVLLKQHLRNLLTHGDPTNFQGQGFQERLAEGCRLAERLARKLSPGKAVVCSVCTELLQEIPLTRIFFLFNLSLWFPCPIWGHHGTSTGGETERRNALGTGHSGPTRCFFPDGQ
nr:PREDICTED: uncharacterized protein LOC103543934 [Equus przewalskii]